MQEKTKNQKINCFTFLTFNYLIALPNIVFDTLLKNNSLNHLQTNKDQMLRKKKKFNKQFLPNRKKDFKRKC